MPRIQRIPHRYLLAAMAGLCCSLTIGTRTAFSLVMTHVTFTVQLPTSSESFLFHNCTVYNSSSDLRMDKAGEVMFNIHTACFVFYALMMVPGSILSTGLSPKLVLGWITGAAGVVCFLLPLAIPHSDLGVAVLRVCHGILEGIKHPTSMSILGAWSTKGDKSILYGITGIGIYAAPAMASGLTSILLCYVSWDGIFYLYGGASMLWVVLWLRWFYNSPDCHPSLEASERQFFKEHGDTIQPSSARLLKSVPWLSIIRSCAVWAVFIGCLIGNIFQSLLVTQAPQYYLDAYQLRVEDIGVLSMIPYITLSVISMAGGMVADRIISTGFLAITNVRKTMYTVAYTIQGVSILALHWVSDWRAALVIICCGVPFGGLAMVAYTSLPSEMAPDFATVILGLAFLGVLGGAVSSGMASAIAGKTKTLESWQTIFLIIGVWDIISIILFNVTADATRQSWADGSACAHENGDSTLRLASDDHSSASDYEDSASFILSAGQVSENVEHQLDGVDGPRNYGTLK